MLKISNIMFFFAIIILTLLFWATSNVCKYNIALDKKTNQLNLLAQEIDPSIPNAKVYYLSSPIQKDYFRFGFEEYLFFLCINISL